MRQIEKFSTKSDKMWFTKWDPGWISRLWSGKAEGNFLVQFQFIIFCEAQKCHLPDINSLCIGDGGKRRVDGGGLSKSWQLTKRSNLTWVDIEWTLINCDLSGHGEEGGDPESHPRRHSLRVEPEVHLQPQSWVMEMMIGCDGRDVRSPGLNWFDFGASYDLIILKIWQIVRRQTQETMTSMHPGT